MSTKNTSVLLQVVETETSLQFEVFTTTNTLDMSTEISTHHTVSVQSVLPNIPSDARWDQKEITVAGGHGRGNATNQLSYSYGLFIDDDDEATIITDYSNHRIVKWKIGEKSGHIVAGGNGQGDRPYQLSYPTDALVDKNTDSLIICDQGNKRVLQWSLSSDLEHIRNDIRTFKKNNNLDKVIVLWTANTERYVDVRQGLNQTSDEILQSIAANDDEISPSNIFACAAILEGCPYINGSPQNTLVPGIIELASKHNVFIGGDDFKSGQTKLKSVLADFLVSAGLKIESIVSYNHLGNNDGKNLSAPQQFRSKEISKSNVVDDMVGANHLLYNKKKNEHPDHVVVIKYVPFVKDSKRAMDEYISSIFMNGLNTIAIHNTCEDSLLASPLIIDLVILTELLTRITYKTNDSEQYQSFEPVLSILSYL
ncbi:unnamed protein product, partial [Rotaria socialis]